MKLIAILLAGLVSALSGCASLQPDGTSGKGAYAEDTDLFEPETFESYGSFVVSAGTESKPVNMRLWYSRPDKIEAGTPVVMVMHGARRDANTYRDYWGTYARRHNALIIVPEFSQEDFPTGWGYQTGNWVTADSASYDESKGQRNPPEESSFAALERAFDAVKDQFALDAETYDIWGHGSGAQFVHRMVMMWPQARIGTAVAANAGSYTFPDWTLPLRYGLKNTGIEPEDLKPAYKHRLVIMLGSEDNDPSHRLLSQLDIALAQGKHRVEKGQNFYKVNKAQAEKLNTEYNWEIQTVYGIAHSGQKMTKSGAELLLQGKTEKALFSDEEGWNRQDDQEDSSEGRESSSDLLRGSDDGEESPF